MSVTVTQATVADVPLITPLFNAYRMFYKQHSNLKAASAFIHARLVNNESVIFIAFDGGKAVGFTQLYPIFSSVGMQRTWLLNDLYVAEPARSKGIAKALLDAAKEHGRQTGSRWLMLQTATGNLAAQHVYESNGWKKDNDYYVYNYRLVA
jgi:GNAT superfamily N-acetyltransferase